MATFEDLTDAQRLALAKAGHKLLQNPEVASDAKRLLMKADKSLRFPEIETADAIDGQLKKRDEKIEALENKLVQTEAQQRLAEKKAQAAARGLEWDDVQKAITERGIANVETAMEFVELTKRSAVPTPAAYDEPIDLIPAAAEKDFWANPQKAVREMAHQTIDELKARRMGQR
jgi:hypothetical protein